MSTYETRKTIITRHEVLLAKSAINYAATLRSLRRELEYAESLLQQSLGDVPKRWTASDDDYAFAKKLATKRVGQCITPYPLAAYSNGRPPVDQAVDAMSEAVALERMLFLHEEITK